MDKGAYQALHDWEQSLGSSKLIEFPVKKCDQKAYIYLKLDNYEEWSD